MNRRSASSRRDKSPSKWAPTKNNMASALSSLGEREAERDNLTRSTRPMRRRSTVVHARKSPDDWAATYGNLAIVYWRLGQRENGTALLKKAAEMLSRGAGSSGDQEAAARVGRDAGQSRRVFPNSANARRSNDYLRAAIEAHKAALTVYTREAAPLDWAEATSILAPPMSGWASARRIWRC